MTRTIIVVAVASLVGITGLLAGCGRCGYRHGSPERKAGYVVRMLSSKLDLTEPQRAKLEEIKTQVLAKFHEHKADRAALRQEVVSLVRAPQLDRDRINKIAEKREASFRAIKPFIIDKLAEFHAMLTPEQKTALADQIEKMFARHGRGE